MCVAGDGKRPSADVRQVVTDALAGVGEGWLVSRFTICRMRSQKFAGCFKTAMAKAAQTFYPLTMDSFYLRVNIRLGMKSGVLPPKPLKLCSQLCLTRKVPHDRRKYRSHLTHILFKTLDSRPEGSHLEEWLDHSDQFFKVASLGHALDCQCMSDIEIYIGSVSV